MTTKLKLRGVKVRYIDVRPKEAGVVLRAHLSADMSDDLRDAMEWPTFEAQGDTTLEWAKLAGLVRLSSVKLNPNSMKQHAIDVAALEISHFEFVRVPAGGGSRNEIRFRLMTDSQDSILKLVGYVLAVGDVDAAVTCTLTAAQDNMFPDDAAGPDTIEQLELAADGEVKAAKPKRGAKA